MPDASAPFPVLDVVRVRHVLGESAFADLRWQAVTGSTNVDATRYLVAAPGATFIAEEQTAGRGRLAGRTWIAPPGSGLTFTTILPFPVASNALWAIPFWVALAVAEGIANACALHADLRWPNDLFLDGKKVAGILCVSRVAGERAYVGCGVGINVHRPPHGTDAIAPPPAFLSDRAPNVVREFVLTSILFAYEQRLGSLHAPAAIARTYEERAGLNGAPYRVHLDRDGTILEGTARGLGPEGTLRLVADGMEHIVSLADARRL